MAHSAVNTELNIPKKYTKPGTRYDRIEAIVNKTWLRQFVKHRRVPEFILHDKLSDEEAFSLLQQGEKFTLGWQKIIISVIRKEEKLVIPLPRVKLGSKPEVQLSLSQILQYVSHTNYKNLWKEAFKKFNHGWTPKDRSDNSYVQLTEQSALIRDVLSRTYGAPLIRLHESQCYQDNNYSQHANLLPASFIVESNHNFFIIHECSLDYTVQDCVTFSPSLLAGSYAKPMFIVYQLLRLMRHLHDMGLVLGNINLSDIYIGQDLWIQVLPCLTDNIHSAPGQIIRTETEIPPHQDTDGAAELGRLTEAWAYRALSNFDYLCELNRLAGRREGDPRSHYVLPWVTDFSCRSGANWRDLTKSKFRLNKGDRQLDLTYDLPSNATQAQIPHHVPDVLSEITYYVYLARVTPKTVLCKYVRPQWVPAEYPASIQRLQAWSPDECIPEFFTSPSVFKSIHSDLCDLEVPPWCSSPNEFIAKHRAALESQHVSERLHHWIDLTFGYKLSGIAAVKSKNVCLTLVDGHKELTGSGVVQLFMAPHPHRLTLSPFWTKIPPRIHHHRRKNCPEEDDGHSTGLEEEEPASSTALSISKLISRSRTSLISSPMSSTSVESEKNISSCIVLPKDYNPVAALQAVEALHSFTWSTCLHVPDCASSSSQPSHQQAQMQLCKQIVAARRAIEMQVLGCLIVEMFLADKMRVYGAGGLKKTTFRERLAHCRSMVFTSQTCQLPRCVTALVHLLIQRSNSNGSGEFPSITETGVPPPSAHQLLQPLLTSSCLVHFPKVFPRLYTVLVSTISYTRALAELTSTTLIDITSQVIIRKISELKVKNLANNIEQLLDENDASLDLILPYILDMLRSPQTDVLAAWYLFDHIARALGPKKTNKVLLEPMLHLYDGEHPSEPLLLKKRIKLYHRSFLIRLTVRFGLATFLESFIVPLVEAVGGYHDYDQNNSGTHSHLACCEVEEAVEADVNMPLSPLDEDSSADSEKASSSQQTHADLPDDNVEPEVFHFEEDSNEESSKIGPKSAISLQNLLIENLDPQALDERESEESNVRLNEGNREGDAFTSEGSWRRKSYANVKHLHLDCDPPDVEYSKVVVDMEVCEVSAESVIWLSHRLGPVLTARHLSRNLLRMLALCYAGNLAPVAPSSLPTTSVVIGDNNAYHLLRCLTAIAGLYGEQVIVVQYIGHMLDLVSVCRRRLTAGLEGALVGCLTLLSQTLGNLSDEVLSECLPDQIVKGLVDPSLRIMASCSVCPPSGADGRRALALKLLSVLTAVTRRATHAHRLHLLGTVQRFFLAFSKAYGHVPDKILDVSVEGEIKVKNKVKEDIYESPPLSITQSEIDPQRSQAQQELRDTLSPEFAYLAFTPFANFFGESTMQQTLRNYDLIKELCKEYIEERSATGCPIPGTRDIEPAEVVEAVSERPTHVGTFSNVVVVGNRIDIQEPVPKNGNHSIEEDTQKVRRVESVRRHLHGNWLAYWEHELGRSNKDNKLNIKQIKLQSFVGHNNSVKHIIVLASENSFMSASRDKTVKLWSLRSQGDGNDASSPQWTYSGHRKSVLCLGFVERHRLSVSCDSVVHVWDPFIGRLVTVVDPTSPPVNALTPVAAPSSSVLCATTDSTVKTLDIRSGTFVNELKVSQNPGGLIRCLVLSPNSSWLALGQASGIITILDLTTGSVLLSWKAHEAEILQLIAVDDHTLISSALNQAVSVWNINDGKLINLLKGPTEPVHCLEMVSEELLFGTTANRIGVHTDIGSTSSFSSTRLRSDTFKGVLTSLAVLPLNRLLLLGADTGHITLIC
ncbi:WD repeat domain 81 isoform X2 [Rhodnius prolixus]|uniref:WD repeat domain 81 isoform X2 n=1 Tax=Rhodnius prolixus TaxID=13249 RepID=UPI003D18E9B4